PDGKKFAFIARGDVFASQSKEPGDATRVTNTSGAEYELVWSRDSKSIVYASDRSGTSHLYRYDFATEKEPQITKGDRGDLLPECSPDGKRLAFQCNHRDVIVLDLASNQTKTIATSHFDRRPFVSPGAFDWSPDSKWIAYIDNNDATSFANAFVVPVG